MKQSLARLLTGIIDYAGLFPPAKLDMAPAVENYLRYIHGSEKWLVSRFVCSTQRLPELERELAEHPEEPFVPVTVVGHASTDRKSWEHALTHDSEAMNRFLQEADGHADIEAFEIRAPDHQHIESWIKDLSGFRDVDIYVELPWGHGIADSISLLAETEGLGAKGRTGGLEASAFPSAADLALFLQQCMQLDVPFKLTAGLHHPVRRHDNSVQTKMHGFLNVGVAMAMLHGHDLTSRELQQILEEEDPRSFSFSESEARWRDMAASLEDIEHAREVFVSYGSCSVEEPIADLQELGLLEGATV